MQNISYLCSIFQCQKKNLLNALSKLTQEKKK